MISREFGQGSSSSDDDDDDDDDDDEGHCLFALEYSSSSLLSFGGKFKLVMPDPNPLKVGWVLGVFSIEVSKANFSRSNKIPWDHPRFCWFQNLDVSKNRGPPKWMVKIMENPIKMDDLGFFPLFLETPISINLKGDIWGGGCHRKIPQLEKETYLQTTNSLVPC